MGFDSNEPEQRQRLKAVLSGASITVGALWLQYFSIGGSVGEYEVEAYLQGMLSLPELERDLLAMAANELMFGAGPRAPYSDEFPPNEQPSGKENDSPEDGQASP
ncbi:hypothetical protein [Paenarthrobacter aurescens]|uniref:Uncharacterized protein n=1 Tax=Paenarthrobacter aurescens TaxID=43663 RepID=A0A4Y3NB33_PAEAU|nr:hypothetical protein [Paenarthrobacter aurescens]UKA50176.1 hypothetical protein LFT48_01135 [Arthrobacter sp. FW305-123]MDO6141903.1 hypothetical protein [Paenarthrobacter aurescens]MDO6145708.1 hypothetical protein [Paenarthrobacter aurescens]MDO6156952.1 hypothetical protein [Paenarthrobacter aurescens]MDO6160938.1 hypothetical protein [Paenarthrobacter aurescens]